MQRKFGIFIKTLLGVLTWDSSGFSLLYNLTTRKKKQNNACYSWEASGKEFENH